MKKDSIAIGCLTGILAVIMLTALTVGLLLSGHWFYSLQIDALDIEQASGLARAAIIENYDAVISFLSPFNNAKFSMPSLPASDAGINHFEDVKTLIRGLYIAGAASAALLAAIALLLRKRIRARSLLAASVCSLALPAIMIGGIALDFDGFFVLFHKLFFTNDDWLFNYVTDPVINILPAKYFMNCGVIL
ncbi:MAG: TIGR01906 family membrane protein, partial [Oscillospiraceae bacterium]|nr:TIGR01906 family membrane protein [Oscillospiraceae bacterium]